MILIGIQAEGNLIIYNKNDYVASGIFIVDHASETMRKSDKPYYGMTEDYNFFLRAFLCSLNVT